AQHQPDARPDAVVIAKGLGAGYVPLAAAAFPRELVDTLTRAADFDLSHTYNANPISCAAGCAVLDEIVDHQLIENGARMGDLLKARLDELATRYPIIGDVRGKGLMLGVELVSDREARTAFPGAADVSGRVRKVAMQNGLLIGGRRLNGGAFGEFLMLTPALIISPDVVEELVERLDLTLEQVTEVLRVEGFLKG
ncbi:aminotransferase class III-fold pyridoxal phosphate-dependent enzyme, partial [Streptomyces asiaticus]